MSFWCLEDPGCPIRSWSREQVVAVHDALDELLFCIRRAHPELLKDRDRWEDLVEDGSDTPGDLDDDF
jgi:hypothetical protein